MKRVIALALLASAALVFTATTSAKHHQPKPPGIVGGGIGLGPAVNKHGIVPASPAPQTTCNESGNCVTSGCKSPPHKKPKPKSSCSSAVAAVPPVAAEGTREKIRKTKTSEKRKTKRPEKKRPSPPAPVSEPSLAPPPTTKKRSPAPIQPAREPVASSPAPSSGSGAGGTSDPPPQVQNDPPQLQHGIGDGEASHGIAPAGG